MALMLATTLTQVPPPGPVDLPYRPSRPNVEDDEIVWLAGAEPRYWLQVLRVAAASPKVIRAVETYGLAHTCTWFSEMRGGTVARYFRPYRETVIAELRGELPPQKLVESAEYGPYLFASIVGSAAFSRAMKKADEQARPNIGIAAQAVVARIDLWASGTGPAQLRDRLRPETLAALRGHPDLLPLWCAIPAGSRENAVGGYAKGEN